MKVPSTMSVFTTIQVLQIATLKKRIAQQRENEYASIKEI